MAFFMATY